MLAESINSNYDDGSNEPEIQFDPEVFKMVAELRSEWKLPSTFLFEDRNDIQDDDENSEDKNAEGFYDLLEKAKAEENAGGLPDVDVAVATGGMKLDSQHPKERDRPWSDSSSCGCFRSGGWDTGVTPLPVRRSPKYRTIGLLTEVMRRYKTIGVPKTYSQVEIKNLIAQAYSPYMDESQRRFLLQKVQGFISLDDSLLPELLTSSDYKPGLFDLLKLLLRNHFSEYSHGMIAVIEIVLDIVIKSLDLVSDDAPILNCIKEESSSPGYELHKLLLKLSDPSTNRHISKDVCSKLPSEFQKFPFLTGKLYENPYTDNPAILEHSCGIPSHLFNSNLMLLKWKSYFSATLDCRSFGTSINEKVAKDFNELDVETTLVGKDLDLLPEVEFKKIFPNCHGLIYESFRGYMSDLLLIGRQLEQVQNVRLSGHGQQTYQVGDNIVVAQGNILNQAEKHFGFKFARGVITSMMTQRVAKVFLFDFGESIQVNIDEVVPLPKYLTGNPPLLRFVKIKGIQGKVNQIGKKAAKILLKLTDIKSAEVILSQRDFEIASLFKLIDSQMKYLQLLGIRYLRFFFELIRDKGMFLNKKSDEVACLRLVRFIRERQENMENKDSLCGLYFALNMFHPDQVINLSFKGKIQNLMFDMISYHSANKKKGRYFIPLIKEMQSMLRSGNSHSFHQNPNWHKVKAGRPSISTTTTDHFRNLHQTRPKMEKKVEWDQNQGWKMDEDICVSVVDSRNEISDSETWWQVAENPKDGQRKSSLGVNKTAKLHEDSSVTEVYSGTVYMDPSCVFIRADDPIGLEEGELAHHIIAFLNSNAAGLVIIGANPMTRSVEGMNKNKKDNDLFRTNLNNLLCQKIEPRVCPDLVHLNICDVLYSHGFNTFKQVMFLRIRKSEKPPQVLHKLKLNGKFYLRHREQTLELTPELSTKLNIDTLLLSL